MCEESDNDNKDTVFLLQTDFANDSLDSQLGAVLKSFNLEKHRLGNSKPTLGSGPIFRVIDEVSRSAIFFKILIMIRFLPCAVQFICHSKPYICNFQSCSFSLFFHPCGF